MKSDEDLKHYMQCELAPYTLVFFDVSETRKNKYTLFKKIVKDVDLRSLKFLCTSGKSVECIGREQDKKIIQKLLFLRILLRNRFKVS